MSYLKNQVPVRNPRATPQSRPIPETAQVRNHAGGYSWEVDDWTRLDRFLILGSEAGTYYVGENKLSREHAQTAERLVAQDGVRVVNRLVEISQKGLAPKNDPALFVLALASAKGDAETRAAAFAALPLVARTATHLFDFLTFRQGFGGWGRGLRRAVSGWYLDRGPDSLALQIVKYRQRNGWTHRDVLRKAHPDAGQTVHGDGFAKQDLLRYAVKGISGVQGLASDSEREIAGESFYVRYPHPLVAGYEMASRSPSPKVTAGLIREYGLPREAVLTEHLNDPEVWQALLDVQMPITALIRNLATMTRVGLLKPLSNAMVQVVDALTREELIRKGRVHPVQILAAMKTYGQGHGVRGTATWKPVAQVMDALDKAFYLSFGNVQPTGKRTVLGLDVSGSMDGTLVNGVPGLSAREACGAMALVTAAVEPLHGFVAFDTGIYPLAISPRQRLDDVVKLLARTGGGGTDCALPIKYAQAEKLPVDAFVVYTDSETWAGRQHPAQAIREYRDRTGIGAKLVVVAMASSRHTIADPKDAGVLNVVGFDASAPNVISQFIAG